MPSCCERGREAACIAGRRKSIEKVVEDFIVPIYERSRSYTENKEISNEGINVASHADTTAAAWKFLRYTSFAWPSTIASAQYVPEAEGDASSSSVSSGIMGI